VALVRSWLRAAEDSAGPAERREAARLRDLTRDPRSVAFAMAFFDRVIRPESPVVAAGQLRALVQGPLPPFLSPVDRALLRVGAWVSSALPRVVLPLAHRRLRQLVGGLVVDRADPALHQHLERLEAAGYRINANLLGESVLGEGESAHRHAATLELLARPDVSYVSIKASSVASQLNIWAYEHSLERVKARLREMFRAALGPPVKFVNLDMEEYKDLRLTLDAFMQLLDEPELRGLEAGIVLQAYLPDSFAALQELVEWAQRRRAAGGAGIKVRIVKGANLAMERVDAVVHGWAQAPYTTKADTDANYKRLVDWVLQPERVAAVRVGVGSHNLFDVAWVHLLAQARGVAERVEFEMLQGMAPGIARTVRAATGGLLLYTPVVAAADFDTALAYLFRRLEENSSGANFLRHLFDLAQDEKAFAVEQARFEGAIAARTQVSASARRRSAAPRSEPTAEFANTPDTDPTDPAARAALLAALAAPPELVLPDELDVAGVDRAFATAQQGLASWRSRDARERARLLQQVGDALALRRVALVAIMAHEAGKTIPEGDGEVSEAIDFARYYACRIPELATRQAARFEPLGTLAVIPPWNFPLAIPAGGVLAALAAGNTVLLKPSPQTPRTALALAEACWAAGIPRDALQYVRCPDAEVGEHLIAHADLGGIILTGAYDTAELFTKLAPTTPLFAETSGKNAIVVMPDADLDLAVADIVKSAFGHAGQKCSAASLAICVGEVADSERFRRQLVDAARSLEVAHSTRPEAVVGPLIGEPPAKLSRALTSLRPGESWLLEPRLLDAATHLWSPGILDGVVPGSWFHQTECFGPVLGLMRARDLDEALAFQNGVVYGLTGGIHSLDPANVERWLARVEVGNAYVNRPITGAIVQRQPFGGWKRSVVGPGAKAGGPNYVAQLGHWHGEGSPEEGKPPFPRILDLVRTLAEGFEAADARRLMAAARSDAYWWEAEFGAEHDPTGLFCEANLFRYRPLPRIVLRIAASALPVEVARVLVATTLAGCAIAISADPAYPASLGPFDLRRETPEAFAVRMATARPERVRAVGKEAIVHTPSVATFIDARPVLDNGRLEMPRYLREQAISRTLHRFGNLVQSARA